MENQSQLIARLCINKFNELPKTGKPCPGQWTTLAGFVVEENGCIKLAALSTGTKCVTGKASLEPGVIIDCHAEILARRGFKRYLMDRLIKGHQVEDWPVHLFVTQLPCGTLDRYQGLNKQNPLLGVHRKPGRGEPCLEPSCIDKILKWTILGVQGRRLISYTNGPLKIKSLIIGNCSEPKEYDQACIEKALDPNIGAALTTEIFAHKMPDLFFLENLKCAPFIRRENLQASPSAVVFWEENCIPHCEVVVEGLKQGVTRKKAAENRLKISKTVLRETFNELKLTKSDYNKNLQLLYQERWKNFTSLKRFLGWKVSS